MFICLQHVLTTAINVQCLDNVTPMDVCKVSGITQKRSIQNYAANVSSSEFCLLALSQQNMAFCL